MDKPILYEGINTLEQRLKQSDRVFTLGDAAALTGYSLDQAKQVLDSLMNKYDCRLQVTENGDLIYDFGKKLHPRGERTWAEWWYQTKQRLWKIFVVIFKAWITVTLVVYFVIFLVILIALVIAMMSGNDDDNSSSSSDASGLFLFIGDMFRSIFIWNTITGNTYYDRDHRGYNYRRYESRPSVFGRLNKKKKQGKNFVASVYDFVFGPPRVDTNPLANQQEVASYLRKNKGIVVIPEIIALAGWTAEQAEEFFTEVLIRYQGDSKLSENSILYGDFFELARTQTDEADAPIEWYWDEYEPEYKLTGNSTARNAGVIGMNLFNLIFASVISFGYFQNPYAFGDNTSLIFILLGIIPLVFSFLFFLVPILRSFRIRPLEQQRHLENIRKRLMRVVYKSPEVAIAQDRLLETVNAQNEAEEKLSQADIDEMMHRLILDFYGEIDPQADGQVIYRFIHLREQLNEVERLREQRASGKDLGNIIFDTKE